MPTTNQRISPSGPFVIPDSADSGNGIPIAKLRCIPAAGDLALTDTSGPVTSVCTALTSPITIPAIGTYRLDVAAKFLNRKTGSTTTARVDVTVEVYNSTTGLWIDAGGADDVLFAALPNQNAVHAGNAAVIPTAGTYTQARITLSANAGNTAVYSLAGMLGGGVDGNVVDVELYQLP